jgi:hypothetical protein
VRTQVYGEWYTLNGFQSLAIQGGGGIDAFAASAIATPEPGTLWLAGAGVAVLLRRRRRG